MELTGKKKKKKKKNLAAKANVAIYIVADLELKMLIRAYNLVFKLLGSYFVSHCFNFLIFFLIVAIALIINYSDFIVSL